MLSMVQVLVSKNVIALQADHEVHLVRRLKLFVEDVDLSVAVPNRIHGFAPDEKAIVTHQILDLLMDLIGLNVKPDTRGFQVRLQCVL